MNFKLFKTHDDKIITKWLNEIDLDFLPEISHFSSFE